MNLRQKSNRAWKRIMNQKRRWLKAIEAGQHDLARSLTSHMVQSVKYYRHLVDTPF